MLLGFLADFPQFLFGFLDAPATLRRHLAKEIIREAAIGTVASARPRRFEEAALIVGPLPFSFDLASDALRSLWVIPGKLIRCQFWCQFD